jgi:hypothetical protein
MPERHRHHHSSEQPKSFTMTLESCSRSSGIRVHDALETAITIGRNMQLGDWRSYAMVLKYAHLCPDKLAEAANLVTRKGHTNRKKHAARR